MQSFEHGIAALAVDPANKFHVLFEEAVRATS